MIWKIVIFFFAAVMPLGLLAEESKYVIESGKLNSHSVIKIDGKLNENFWQQMKPVSGFERVMTPGKVECQTKIKILYSSKALYLGIEMVEPLIDKLAGKGGVIWADDRIEFPLMVDKDAGEYFLFAVNCEGKKEEGCFGSAEYDDAVKDFKVPWQAAVYKGSGSWFIEVKIPFSSLKTVPEPGTIWYINFCRQRSPGDLKPVFSALNPKFNGFHYSGCKLVFKPEKTTKGKLK